MRHRDDKKRAAVCQAAISLINELGLDGVSMSKIAKRANVSPATIYIYFKNKEDMLTKLYLTVKYQMSSAFLKDFDLTLDVKSSFRRLWTNHLDYILENSAEFRFAEQFVNSPSIHKVLEEESTQLYVPVFNLFDRGIKEGILKKYPHQLFLIYTFSPVIRLVKEYREKVISEKLKHMAFEAAWDAISIKKRA